VKACLRLAFFIADAFVFDDVFMVKVSDGVDFFSQVVALILCFQRFDGHQLTCLISIRIIQTQFHRPKVTLDKIY